MQEGKEGKGASMNIGREIGSEGKRGKAAKDKRIEREREIEREK